MPQDHPPSRHLVAPELEAMLEVFPKVDFSQGVEAWRGPILADARPPLSDALAAVELEERAIPGPHGAPDVRLLIYRPPGLGEGPHPVLLNIHGGGYVIGSPEQNDPMNRARAVALGCPVVATSYRLAPETAFPGAVEDCYAALCWVAAHAEELGLDASRIAISGESAGGGHAAALALHARDRRRAGEDAPVVCLQLLDSPMLDDRTGSSADPHPWTGQFTWTRDHNAFGWSSLLGQEAGSAEVPEHAVPARVQDLSDLPPACITIGGLDLFLEESLEYARRLSRAGVPVELHVIPGGYHGFGLAASSPQARQKDELELAALRRGLGIGQG